MHRLFLDESGQLSERRFFALGGITVRDRDWHTLRDLWQATVVEHGWPTDREIKWHGIRTGEVRPPLADASISSSARPRRQSSSGPPSGEHVRRTATWADYWS
jgi:hypothetical protein